MFDIGFWEVAIIGVIALLVLGPERLPRVARTAGKYLSKARSTWSSVRREIERELAAEDLRRDLEQPIKAATDVRDELNESLRAAKADVQLDPARHVADSPQPSDESTNEAQTAADEQKADMADGKS